MKETSFNRCLSKSAIIAAFVVGGISIHLSRRPLERHEPTTHVVRSLKVTTFNVQFLPGIGRLANKRGDVLYRAGAIASRLSACDIIGFNETFDAEPRDLLLESLRDRIGISFQVVLPGEKEKSVFGWDSGLALVSRLPIQAFHTMNYDNDSSIWKHGLFADGFVKKGAIHARLACGNTAFPNEVIDVFVTHIESQDSNIRDAQLPMFAEFVRVHSASNRPAVMLGDFNVDGRPALMADATSQYSRLLGALKSARSECDVVDIWPTFHREAGATNSPDAQDKGERIDYIFVSNPHDKSSHLLPLSITVNPMLDSRVLSLSDHSAVEAEFSWLSRNRTAE